jgi:hypothetical protein
LPGKRSHASASSGHQPNRSPDARVRDPRGALCSLRFDDPAARRARSRDHESTRAAIGARRVGLDLESGVQLTKSGVVCLRIGTARSPLVAKNFTSDVDLCLTGVRSHP